MPEHFIANDQLPKQPLTDQAYTVMGADPEIRGWGGGGGMGRLKKIFLGPLGVGGGPLPWNLRASVWSKNKGGGPSSGSATVL